MTLQKTNYPCWLSQSRLQQAKKLLELGFTYIGNVDDFCECSCKLGSVDGWEFYSAYGEVAIDAVFDGALYSLYFEDYDNKDYESEVNKAKKAIRRSKKEQTLSCKQLSLF